MTEQIDDTSAEASGGTPHTGEPGSSGEPVGATAAVPPETVQGGGVFLEETAGGSREPYDFSAATITCVLTIHPDDGHEDGRLVSMLVRSHKDAPLCASVRRNKLGHFPAALGALLKELRADFPDRERQARARADVRAQDAAKKAAEKAAQKARHQAPKSAKPAKAGAAKPQTEKKGGTPGAPPAKEPAVTVGATAASPAQEGLFS